MRIAAVGRMLGCRLPGAPGQGPGRGMRRRIVGEWSWGYTVGAVVLYG